MHNSKNSRRAKRNKFGDKPGSFPAPSPKPEAPAFPNGKLVRHANSGLVRDKRTGSYDLVDAKLPMGDWMSLANEGHRRDSSYTLHYLRKGKLVNSGRPQRIGGLAPSNGPTSSVRKRKPKATALPDTRPKVRSQWRDMGRDPDVIETFRPQPVVCDNASASFGRAHNWQPYAKQVTRHKLVARMVKALSDE